MTVNEARRTMGAIAVAASVVVWWPAFTLGVWGVVFYEQIMTLWAAATAAFVVAILKQGARRLPRTLTASLLLPSLWVLLAFLPTDQGGMVARLIGWFGVALTVIGLPFMVWVILQMARPDVTVLVTVRTWMAVGVAVAIVAALAFTLGRAHPWFLTCDDFRLSGNSQPANCTPGPSSLG